MPTKTESKDVGMIPGAHPKAPGGMSQKALAAELVADHGYDSTQIIALSWPQLIDTVAKQRRAREIEATEAARPVLFLGMPDSVDYIFDGHAGASPSGAERWMNCTASVEATRKFLETLTPNQQAAIAKSGIAASQGTTAHSAAEVEALVVLGRLSVEEAEMTLVELTLVPETEGEAYSDEMGEYITEYVDLVRGYASERGEDHILIEHRVTAVVELLTVDSEGDRDIHEITGSLDFAALPTPPHPELVVGDLKYGEGIDVDVDENPQIRIYALGLLSDLAEANGGELPESLTDITYHIIQPRLGGIKTWTETVDDLLDWCEDALSPALTLVLQGQKGGAAFTPSDLACQWCLVRGSCEALIEQRLAAGAELFDTIIEGEASGEGFPETGTLTDDRLGSLYAQISGLVKLRDEMKEELQRRLYRGITVPGFWLVNYSPPRKWSDDVTGEEEILNRAELWTEPALMSPPAAIKVLARSTEGSTAKAREAAATALLAPLITKPDKVPVVSTGPGDKRSKWEGKAPEDMFSDESGDIAEFDNWIQENLR